MCEYFPRFIDCKFISYIVCYLLQKGFLLYVYRSTYCVCHYLRCLHLGCRRDNEALLVDLCNARMLLSSNREKKIVCKTSTPYVFYGVMTVCMASAVFTVRTAR